MAKRTHVLDARPPMDYNPVAVIEITVGTTDHMSCPSLMELEGKGHIDRLPPEGTVGLAPWLEVPCTKELGETI